jgi:two-component system cell cycle sensor histidine kinase/response regulator CckA
MPHSQEARVLEGFNPERAMAHLAAIVESSDDAIIGKTLEGIILSWNAGACRLYGYTAAEAIGQSMTLLLPEDRPGEESEILARIARGERVDHFETRRRRKNGETIDVSLTISPILDKNGVVIGASHVARDITERKFMNGQSARLAAIVQSSEDAVVSKTLEGTILTWNGGAERLYGYPAAEAIGKPITLVLPEDRAQEEVEILERIRSGQEVNHFETVRRRKNGELIDVSLTISPISDEFGRVIGASHVARNITERRGLEERSGQLAAIVESADDAIISKTLDGTILTWNAGAERIYGYTAAEIIGRPMTLLLPADRPDEETEILERIRKGERVEHFETVRKTKTGERIEVSLTISPIRDSHGKITGASHVARDVTERKQLENQLRHTQKLESLGVLAGGVAHDFNNLLTGILGNASLALESLSSHHPVRAQLRDVVNASERASHLTRQLLAYAGKGRFVIEPVNISGLVREISHLIQTSISKNVQLRLELADDVPLIEADAGQIQQVIMNLVINGSEAVGPTENGTVLVTTGVQMVDEHYLLSTVGESAGLKPGMFVSLEVHDTGCGMDQLTMSRIFDPFFTTKFMGRGLGLAAVQGIVRGHSGTIKVYSRPGNGTTFKVLFPATEGLAQPKAPLIAPALARDQLILVIDDEDIVRRTAKSMLERNGYTVVVAENGEEGVELFNVLAEKVSAVLLDMTMPVMNGEEAFSRLRSIRADVKVILSSGYNEVEAIRRFTGKGLAGFIQKPYTSVALAEKIKSVLENPLGLISGEPTPP